MPAELDGKINPVELLLTSGDRAEFQNEYGAYSPVIYECEPNAR